MFSQKEPLGRMVGEDQIQFLKLLVEDNGFLFLVNDRIDLMWFDVPEVRDIIRTIRDFYDAGDELTYDALKNVLKGHYDLNDISKEISWGIINEVLDDAEKSDNGGWKKYFISKFDDVSMSSNHTPNWC